MKYLFELSKEHKSLPKAEIYSCLSAEDINYNILKENDNVLIIETKNNHDKINRFASRLSLTYYIDEFLFSSQPDLSKIKNRSIKNNIDLPGSIVVRYKNRSKNINSQDIVKTLAEVYTKNRKVSLRDPDLEIRAYITDSIIYVGIKNIEINRTEFEKRKAQHRPFFLPISLHPKLARVLVNLSEIKKNETLMDPFCGTGGFLIEAGLIGAKIIGSDIEEKMIDGCKKTLDFYGINKYELFCSDIGKINKHVKKVDAIVTDMPYGKSTTTRGEKIEELYLRAFKNIAEILRKDGRAVIGVSNKKSISIGEKFFNLVDLHEFKAHGSLTRYFPVFQK